MKYILIADDAVFMRILLKSMLERNIDTNEYELVDASDGEELVHLYQNMKDNGSEISLVITDITMPKMNGDKAAELIRKIDKNQKIFAASSLPSIIVTPDLFNYWISKPFEEETIAKLCTTFFFPLENIKLEDISTKFFYQFLRFNMKEHVLKYLEYDYDVNQTIEGTDLVDVLVEYNLIDLAVLLSDYEHKMNDELKAKFNKIRMKAITGTKLRA